MKTIKLIFAATIMTLSCFGQSDSINNIRETTSPPTDNSIKGSDEDIKSNQNENTYDQNKNLDNQNKEEYKQVQDQNTKKINNHITKDEKVNYKNEKYNSEGDYFVMKDGKVMIVKKGVYSGMRQTTLTLENGT